MTSHSQHIVDLCIWLCIGLFEEDLQLFHRSLTEFLELLVIQQPNQDSVIVVQQNVEVLQDEQPERGEK